MKWKTTSLHFIGLGVCLFFAFPAAGQTRSADEYFQQARSMAFDQKNYPEAIRLGNQALRQSPDYLDIQIFVGRLYYWNNQSDSSLIMLQAALKKRPEDKEAAQALADINYFEKDYAAALANSSQGLKHHPASRDLAIRKAQSLAALTRYQEAYAFTDSLLQTNPGHDQLRSLANQLREYSYRNKVGISYDYTWFDKQFTDPWHLTNIDYSRQTKAGSFTGRVSYTERYAKSGLQFEADAYPRISKTFYAYTSIGYSPQMPVFPKLRAGFSLYANLPRSFEAEGGVRYLNFDNNTWIYTVSAGKYWRNFWFNARTYLSPGDNNISRSYTLTTRYYWKGADDYFSFSVSRGISPDDRIQVTRLNSAYGLKTSRVGAGYRFSLTKRHLFSFSATFENGEYLPQTKGNQLNLSAGYQIRF